MMQIIKLNLKAKVLGLAILAPLAFVSGCATNATVEDMRYASPTHPPLQQQALAHHISVGNVDGGHETNPLWTSQVDNANFKKALEQSLSDAGLYQQYPASKYMLNATLLKLDQPMFGLNMTVSCQVHYNLTNVATQKVIYDKDISSVYTATMSDSLYGVTRLRMANEGAIRNNIKALMNDLYTLPGK